MDGDDESLDNADMETMTRANCIETAKWVLDHSEQDTFELEDVLNMAFQLEHYISNGATVAFDCSETLRKTVAGMS